MKVYLNPGHDVVHDSGACHADGTREADIAAQVGELVKGYLEGAGCEVMMRQSDNLCWDSDYSDRQDAAVCPEANQWGADIFVSIHCNAFNATAKGTEDYAMSLRRTSKPSQKLIIMSRSGRECTYNIDLSDALRRDQGV